MNKPETRFYFHKGIIAIAVFLFLGDLIIGIVNPTFSLFVRGLGSSLTLIGVLAMMIGLGRLISGVLVGSISDRLGRRKVLMIGMVILASSYLLYSVIKIPTLLMPVHFLQGIGFISVCTVGMTYAMDIVPAEKRGMMLGVFATIGGVGYASGSYLGSQLASNLGYPFVFRLAAGVAVLGFFIALYVIQPDHKRGFDTGNGRNEIYNGLKDIFRNPVILAPCAGNLLMNLIFGGAIITFFPIYASNFGFTTAIIGQLFAIRALVSTLSRIPTGFLVNRIPGWLLMSFALILSTVVMFLLPAFSSLPMFIFLLILEGLAYGIFLISGQATVVKYAGEATRGSALGLYSSAASLGDSLIPPLLGILADMFEVSTVFYVVGCLAVLSIIFIVRSLTHNLKKQAFSVNALGEDNP